MKHAKHIVLTFIYTHIEMNIITNYALHRLIVWELEEQNGAGGGYGGRIKCEIYMLNESKSAQL